MIDDFESYRGLLFSIAYRMLGSAADAEDLVQDAYVRFAAADADVVRDVKAFLVTILTRLALDRLKSASARREEYVGQWLPEPVFTGRDADPFAAAMRDQSVRFALVAALHRLSPQERAVLLLTEVLDYDHAEVADLLGISAAASRQLLHRARERVAKERNRFRPSREEQQRLIGSFIAAIEKGDVGALREVLASDVVTRGDGGGKVAGAGMHPIVGIDNVSRLWLSVAKKAAAAVRIAVDEVNGAPALVVYAGNEVIDILAFDFDGDRIVEIDSVLNPEKLAFARRRFSGSA